MIDDRTLDRVPFFRDLSAAARRELALRAVLLRFPAGETLWRKGMRPRGLFIVLDGEVRVVGAAGERQHVIHTEGPGGTLGDVPFFEGGAYPATALAAQDTLCLSVNRDAILAAIREDPELALALLSRAATRVRHLVDRLDQQVQKSVTGRLAAFLIARYEAEGCGVFTLGGTQVEVAEELGTVREVIVRALHELRETGVIAAAGRGRFEVVDRRALQRLAES